MNQDNKIKVLFVCLHNVARSQMAEAVLKYIGGCEFDVESAGIEPGSNYSPVIQEALKQADVPLPVKETPTQSVQSIVEKNKRYDYVITVCDEEIECPLPFSKNRLSWKFIDPLRDGHGHDEQLSKAMMVRDQIREKIENWIKELER